MGILSYLFGSSDRDPDDVQPTLAGRGPDIDKGRIRTQTEKDLRKVQSQYDPEREEFRRETKRALTRSRYDDDAGPYCWVLAPAWAPSPSMPGSTARHTPLQNNRG